MTIKRRPFRGNLDTTAGGIEGQVAREHHRLVAEGSAALSVAWVVRNAERLRGKTVVPVVCGKNIGTEQFKEIICG